MARHAYTRKLYDQFVEAFREKPGNATACAKMVGVERRMAARAWHEGWAGIVWARPIKEVLEEEQNHARVVAAEKARLLTQAADAEREKSRREAIENLAERLNAKRGIRRGLLAAAVAGANLGPALFSLSNYLLEKTCVRGPDGRWTPKGVTDMEAAGVTPAGAVAMYNRIAQAESRVAIGVDAIEKLERLDEGKATTTLGLVAVELSEEQQLETLELAAELHQEIKDDPARYKGMGAGRGEIH